LSLLTGECSIDFQPNRLTEIASPLMDSPPLHRNVRRREEVAEMNA
jgi:hypothetical protein